MNTLVNTVELKFFEDGASGQWGLAHTGSFDEWGGGDSFNALWDGIGIFHDVFEHYFENVDDHFKDDNAFNVGGEMTAMGMAMYYMYRLNLGSIRQFNTRFTFWESAISTTIHFLQESVQEGYINFGQTLESGVPKQEYTDDYNLESMITEYCYRLKDIRLNDEDEYHSETDYNYAKAYKKSIKKRKIKDLTRYGYNLAEQLVPDNYDNSEILRRFIEQMDSFCKNNDAEELANFFTGMTFKLYRDEDDFVSWEFVLKSNQGEEHDHVLNENNVLYFDLNEYELEHFYEMEEEEDLIAA